MIRIRPTGGTTMGVNKDYVSGSYLKYVKIKHTDLGLYIWDTGLLVTNTGVGYPFLLNL